MLPKTKPLLFQDILFMFHSKGSPSLNENALQFAIYRLFQQLCPFKDDGDGDQRFRKANKEMALFPILIIHQVITHSYTQTIFVSRVFVNCPFQLSYWNFGSPKKLGNGTTNYQP